MLTVRQILAKAEEMDVDPKYALNCRRRYLTGKMFVHEMNLVYWCGFDSDNTEDEWFKALLGVSEAKEIAKIRKELRRLDGALQKFEGGITDEMIERARQYPIDRLVKFHRGKAKAPCHDDRNPSMYHGTRTNRACCPVCNRSWGSIDWLIEWEGKSFVDAVKILSM